MLAMLEARDFGSIDMVFMGAVADCSCRNVKNASVTKTFTNYCDILQTVSRQELKIVWTEPALRSLRKSIKNFKDHSRSLFEQYLVSGVGTSKWHCLEHLVD